MIQVNLFLSVLVFWTHIPECLAHFCRIFPLICHYNFGCIVSTMVLLLLLTAFSNIWCQFFQFFIWHNFNSPFHNCYVNLFYFAFYYLSCTIEATI